MKNISAYFLILVLGWFIGYIHCYMALNNEFSDYIKKEECTFKDIPGKKVLLNNKIPAKIIEVNYEKVN